MNPSIAANQQRLFLAFLGELRPHLRSDSSLPRRIKEIFARHRAIGSRDRKLYRELVYTALRYLPWIDGVKAHDEPSLLDRDPVLAAKIVAWLAPELKPTSAYRAAHCGDWPAVPATLAEKAAVLTCLIPGRANPPAEPSHAHTARRDDSPYPFAPQALLPSWFAEHCPAAFAAPHLDAINSRAQVWVRLQCNDRNLVLDEFRAQHWDITTVPEFPDALGLPPNAEVANSDAYRRGFVEIQDLGSQLVLALAPIPPGGRWLDACAGAGGKTLQLARLLGPAGHVDATDIRVDILDELADRAQRARLTNISIIRNAATHPPKVIARSPAQQNDAAIQLDRAACLGLGGHGAQCAPRDDKNTPVAGHCYDGVLVDAPCSGSGTWRRQPHLKWYVKPETIAAFTKTQREILAANAPRVKPGGLLIYATCSLSHHENHDVVAAFLQTHPEFKSVPPSQTYGANFDGLGTALLPGILNTDGFYVAALRRT